MHQAITRHWIPNVPDFEVELILTFIAQEELGKPEQEFQMRVFGRVLRVIVAQVRDD